MKEVFENKKKLYLFTVVLFLLTSIIIRMLPNNIGDIVSFLVFPIYFLTITLIYYKSNKVNKYMPALLSLIYLLIGYTCINKLMSPIKVLTSFLFSYVPLLIIRVRKKIKKENIKFEEEKVLEDNKSLFTYILPALILLTLEAYYSICTFGVLRIPMNLASMLISLIIVYCIYFIFLLLFRRTDRANITLLILLLVVYIINEGRIYYTSDTLLITDVIFLENATEVAGFADVTFSYCLYFLFFPTLLVIMFLSYLGSVAKNTNIKVKNLKSGVIKAIVSLLVLVVLFVPNETFNKYLINNIYNINKQSDLAITASNTRYFYKYGVLSGLYGKLIETRRYKPNNYDEETLNKVLAKAKENKGTWGKPNIIVVFSESFWDVSKLKDIEFDKEVTPNFNRLKKEGKSIQMISPSYGGMSSNVEFEILTGGSLNYFSKGYTPYLQLFNKDKSKNNPSIINELNKNGYKTKILNSSSSTMFGCKKVYDIYGVNEQSHLFDEIDLKGNYVTDEYLTNEMMKYFDNKSPDEKTFYFMITMGGHMPYYEERYKSYDVNITKSPYSKEINEVVHSYAEGIYLADKELGRIYDYINTLDEDTIVVFFGDHLPHLTTPDGKDALFTTGYLNNNYTLDSVYRQFNTNALILSNYDIEFDDTNYLGPDLLFSYILNNMDVKLSPYYRWLYETKDILPSSNYVVSQDKNGKIYYTLNLNDEMKKMYELRKNMQYMLFK